MRLRLRDWLAAEPFGLAMSSGFFAFYAHTGMLDALLAGKHGTRPVRVAGSSAGALVGGAWAAGVEPDALAEVLHGLRRADFWDPALGAGVLAGRKFDTVLRQLLPVTRIEQCAVPVQISVWDILRRATVVLREGDLADAIRASCAVPVMFHPVRIGGRAFWDGGIADRAGLAEIPDGQRLLFHHIANKAPWHGPRAVDRDLPRRANMVTLVIEGLPRPHPFAMDAGRAALTAARAATARALEMPISPDGIVRVSAQ